MANNYDDKRMELTEHLQELRARIMYVFGMIAVLSISVGSAEPATA